MFAVANSDFDLLKNDAFLEIIEIEVQVPNDFRITETFW